jgi:hypothetical protein
MKNLITSILTLAICLNASGQTKEAVETNISKIKSIPSYYLKGFLYDRKVQRQSLMKDSAYFQITKLDTFAIPFIIPFLSDTTLTGINNECLQTKFKIADIAFFLINDIEAVPFAVVTGGQYCTWTECGGLPDGFFSYMNRERLRFKSQYTNFFYGEKRNEWKKSFYRKSIKKKKKHS